MAFIAGSGERPARMGGTLSSGGSGRSARRAGPTLRSASTPTRAVAIPTAKRGATTSSSLIAPRSARRGGRRSDASARAVRGSGSGPPAPPTRQARRPGGPSAVSPGWSCIATLRSCGAPSPFPFASAFSRAGPFSSLGTNRRARKRPRRARKRPCRARKRRDGPCRSHNASRPPNDAPR